MKPFFDSVRQDFGKLSQKQVDGFNALVREGFNRGLSKPQIAYVLATTWHETATTMQPIEEYGKGKGRPYGRKDSATGHAYYGRGYVQLTWKENYGKMGDLLGVDLVNHPEKALDPAIAAQIIYEGMTRGTFTGKKLGHYINSNMKDYRNARRIVNGTDRAALIAAHAEKFEDALSGIDAPAVEREVGGSGSETARKQGGALAGLLAALLALLRMIFGGKK